MNHQTNHVRCSIHQLRFSRCWRAIAYNYLLELCRLFWSLAKPAQDSLLWAMQCGGASMGNEDSSGDSESGSEDDMPKKYVKWYLGGVQVCRRSFQRMLGIGNGRVSRTRKTFQGFDERCLKGQGPRTRAATASASVNTFMQKMYYSVSESMPTGFLVSSSETYRTRQNHKSSHCHFACLGFCQTI